MSAIPNTAVRAKPQLAFKIDASAEAIGSLTPELVIALCGPIGSPLHQTAEQIENALAAFGYQTELIRLSDMIRLNANKVRQKPNQANKFNGIKSLIEIGDALRENFGKDILAKLAIAKIGADRAHRYGNFQDVADESRQATERKIHSQRICHVIDSIKNEAELKLLRLIYGDALFAIGVFSPLELRKNNLTQTGKLTQEEIELLIDIDSGEEFAHGQSVRDTFPQSDYFLRIDHAVDKLFLEKAVAQISEGIYRFLDLVFRTKVITPTPDERAMYAATSAARNSACLSRQVGAAVTSSTGEMLALGWNDVPQSGGGLYGTKPLFPIMDIRKNPPQQTGGARCFENGSVCHNDAEKATIAELIVKSLVNDKVVNSKDSRKAVETILGDTRVKDLIEFSRAVHAEMHAILAASRVAGDRVLGGKIFVTTYPCHSCARHLVAAGITEVQYIEPYRKSQATKLHMDALTEASEANGKVQLLQYAGIAPRRYHEMFESGNRKVAGKLALSDRLEAMPLTKVSLKAIPRLEQAVVAEIGEKQLALPRIVQPSTHQGNFDHEKNTT